MREWAIEALFWLYSPPEDELSEEANMKIREGAAQALYDDDSEVRERASDVLERLTP